MKTFYWLVKREFWEHRGGFLMAPMITGGIFLLLNLMAIVTGEVMGTTHGINVAFGGNNLQQMAASLDHKSMAMVGAGLDLVMYSPAIIISIVMGFVVFFYALGALYDDRKDRSLLFWKSLPISDTATVLSKLVAATVIAPVIAAVIGTITGILMLLMFAITLSFHGVGRLAPADLVPSFPGDRQPDRHDPALRVVGAPHGGLADALLRMGPQQALPVGGCAPDRGRHRDRLVQPAGNFPCGDHLLA